MGQEYSVDCLLRMTRTSTVHLCPVAELKWILEYTEIDEERVEKADLSVPILVLMPSKELPRPVVVDGAHRLTKAVRVGDSNILGKLVRNYHIQQCKVAR